MELIADDSCRKLFLEFQKAKITPVRVTPEVGAECLYVI